MIIAQNHRVMEVGGEVHTDREQLQSELQSRATHVHPLNLTAFDITIRDHLLYGQVGGEWIPFTRTGFHSLCRILGAPSPYLNKLVDDDLVIRNIKLHPNRVDTPLNVYTQQHDERRLITAVSVHETFTISDAMDRIFNKRMFWEPFDDQQTQFLFTDDHLTISLQLSDVIRDDDVALRPGIQMMIPEGVDTPLTILPQWQLSVGEQQWNWVEKPMVKLTRKEPSVLMLFMDAVSAFETVDVTGSAAPILLDVERVRRQAELPLGAVKRLLSVVRRTFQFPIAAYSIEQLSETVLPGFIELEKQIKRDGDQLRPYEIGAIECPLDTTGFISRYNHLHELMENPLFLERSYRMTRTIMDTILSHFMLRHSES